MSSPETKNARTVVSDSTVGTLAWFSPSSAQGAADSSPASATSMMVEQTEYLWSDNYGFVLSSGQALTGFEVILKNHGNTGGPPTANINDNTVKIVDHTSSIVGNNKAKGPAWPTTVADSAVYGGSTDKWGTSLTVPNARHADFGVAISVDSDATTETNVAEVDAFEFKITFSQGDVDYPAFVGAGLILMCECCAFVAGLFLSADKASKFDLWLKLNVSRTHKQETRCAGRVRSVPSSCPPENNRVSLPSNILREDFSWEPSLDSITQQQDSPETRLSMV